jgi:hypothetical protein
VSEETWLPTAGERCSKEHFGKTNEVTLNFEKRYLSAAEKREKNNERRFENCRSQLQESLEGEIKDVLLSKVDVLVGKQTTRFDLLCPKPCSDHTTQKISFIDIRDSEGAVIGCDAKVSISLLCSKPRAEFSNTITGSYAISRSCVAR